MGFSDIAKAPVSHGVEPHDLETGPGLRVGPRLSSSRATSRRPYRASGLVLGRTFAVPGPESRCPAPPRRRRVSRLQPDEVRPAGKPLIVGITIIALSLGWGGRAQKSIEPQRRNGITFPLSRKVRIPSSA